MFHPDLYQAIFDQHLPTAWRQIWLSHKMLINPWTKVNVATLMMYSAVRVSESGVASSSDFAITGTCYLSWMCLNSDSAILQSRLCWDCWVKKELTNLYFGEGLVDFSEFLVNHWNFVWFLLEMNTMKAVEVNYMVDLIQRIILDCHGEFVRLCAVNIPSLRRRTAVATGIRLWWNLHLAVSVRHRADWKRDPHQMPLFVMFELLWFHWYIDMYRDLC